MRRLPPFAELVAFEAVARHLSFTLAAQELNLTQSAVSHRIRRLEQHFGTALLQRLNPGVALTAAGAALLPRLSGALDNLAQLGAHEGRRLRVAAGAPLCTWWLAGRLHAFMAARPGVSVELLPVGAGDEPMPQADVRILWVPPAEDGPRPRQARLGAEQVFPVCSPKILPHGRPLHDPAQLAALPLIHKMSSASGEWSWPVWLDRLGVAPGRAREAALQAALRVADMGLAMSAAGNGAGVALSRSLLAHDALADGRLVPAVADAQPLESVKKHVVRWSSARAQDADLQAFVEWLVAEAEQTLSHAVRLLHAFARPGQEQGRKPQTASAPA